MENVFIQKKSSLDFSQKNKNNYIFKKEVKKSKMYQIYLHLYKIKKKKKNVIRENKNNVSKIK